MNINKKESVVIAVREAPFRNTGMQGINDIERSVLEFSRECPKVNMTCKTNFICHPRSVEI